MYDDEFLRSKILGFVVFEVELCLGDENNDSVGLCMGDFLKCDNADDDLIASAWKSGSCDEFGIWKNDVGSLILKCPGSFEFLCLVC